MIGAPVCRPVVYGSAMLASPCCVAAEIVGATQSVVGVDQALKTMLGLALVVVLIVVLAWIARRFAGARAGAIEGMRVVGAVPIGTRERIVLVDLGETQLVLGVAPGRVQTLHVRPTPAGAGETPRAEPGFRGTLERVLASRAQR